MPSSWKNSALEPLGRFFPRLAAAVFPDLCPLCREPVSGSGVRLCPDCRASLKPIAPPWCPICGKPFASPTGLSHPCGDCQKRRHPFARARAAAAYSGALAEGIRRFKFHAEFSLHRFLTGLLDEAYARELDGQPPDLVIPVPLHPNRLRKRGFNQALFLAKALCRGRALPLQADNLRRTRDTLSQYGLNAKQREKNVKGAFALRRPEAVAGRSVLLVDDVFTTGATARECARVLRKAQAASVEVLTLARAASI